MDVKTCLWLELEKKAMTRSSLQQKNIKTKLIACELSVKVVVTFGVVLYRNQ